MRADVADEYTVYGRAAEVGDEVDECGSVCVGPVEDVESGVGGYGEAEASEDWGSWAAWESEVDAAEVDAVSDA